MIGYITIGVKDMDKGKAFWGNLLEPLEYKAVADMGRMVLYSCGRDKPMLCICTPYDGNVAAATVTALRTANCRDACLRACVSIRGLEGKSNSSAS